MGGIFLANNLIPAYLNFSDPSPLIEKKVTLTLPTVEIGGTTILVELATSSIIMEKGLSGRTSLAYNRGMLFIFSKPDKYRFWMPDMHFPLDIVWINDGKVIGIEKNISPKFDPASPRFYIPPRPVRYILEVNAGFTKNKGIKIGDNVAFHNINGDQ